MTVGTKSLLFGVHQFIWHPITVWIAWVWLYKSLPTWRECVCIIIHDWGYWGCPEMDGRKGKNHPRRAAELAYTLFDAYHYNLVLCHSRSLAEALKRTPSKLCWADKASVLFDWSPFYLLRAVLSGEIHEYRRNAWGYVDGTLPNSFWLLWFKNYTRGLIKGKAEEFVE